MVFQMSKSKHLKYLGLASIALFYTGYSCTTLANDTQYEGAISISQMFAVGTSNDKNDLARTTLLPSFEAKTRSGWRAKMTLRLERYDADTGLGTRDTFDSISKPWEISDSTYLEIERATLTWRKRATRITFGKQTFAWGVLDGIQVTDRFDATRKREAIFVDQRPDRIPRWGARAEFRAAKIRWDIGLLLDGTGDQLASLGSTYAVQAGRYRAGIMAGQDLPPINVNTSDDATGGLRGSSRLGKYDVSLLVIHGPDPEPLFLLSNNAIDITYESRTLLGTTIQRPDGPRVWRLEVASINNQPVNTSNNGLSIEDRSRWLAGVGLDWDLPQNTFLNIQVGVDYISGDGLFRPNKDVISTIKLQKMLMNDSLKVSAELIGSLRENDGTFRPAIALQVSDTFYLQAGIDVVWGDVNEVLGQFSKTDRVWLRATWEF